jgi:LPXTG-motif cell wall-anchored protein
MPPFSRRLRAAAFVLYGLAAAGTAALAQNESSTIGNPQLKDFTLPGQRTTPPATPPPSTRPAQVPAADPPRAATPAPAVAERERPVAAPRRDAPAAGRDAAPVVAAPAAPSPAPQTAAPPPVETPPIETAPAPEPGAPAPEAPEAQGSSWPWPAVGGALLLLLGALLLLRRRRAGAALERARDEARNELGGALLPAPEPAPRPKPAPKPAPEPEAPAAPRPWLELDIVPERAAATDSEAVVHYALTVTNQGDSEARNIRIDPRLFNAGAEGDMAAFLQGPIHEVSGSPQVVIAPGGTLKLNGQVAMPMAEVREIEMAGRRIFVPMVAINVAYDWAGGTGRTSRSWLVGREAETPQAKMGPFRLDLGPRIYRSVGRREAKLIKA